MATKKKVVKKAASKKAAPKKAPAKKATVKKAAPKKTAKKAAPVKKAEPAKEVVAANEPRKRGRKHKMDAATIKRVAPRIVKRVAPNAARPDMQEYVPVDTAKAVAFGMSIVEQMKRERALADERAEKARLEEEIALGRRPMTRAKGKSTERFPAADLKEFKKLLLDARAKALKGVDAMKATGFNEAEDHEADGGDGTAQTLRLQALGQMGNINRVIQQIDEALHRIGDGTYGVCASCGQLIRKARLLNSPFALTCMECQQEVERSLQ